MGHEIGAFASRDGAVTQLLELGAPNLWFFLPLGDGGTVSHGGDVYLLSKSDGCFCEKSLQGIL